MEVTREMVGQPAWWMLAPVIIREVSTDGTRTLVFVEDAFTEHRAWVGPDRLDPRSSHDVLGRGCERGQHVFVSPVLTERETTADNAYYVCENCPAQRGRDGHAVE